MSAEIPVEEADPSEKVLLAGAFKKLEMDIMRGSVVQSGRRIDGRDLKTVRPIVSEVHVLARTHGSALFTRGETRALSSWQPSAPARTSSTSTPRGHQEGASCCTTTSALLGRRDRPHEARPGRREIGHGKLAWRALRPLLPTADQFPYTIRVVSEITESNGSSSEVATMCGASLALMDAGVPLKAPVAGIAMGLIKEGNDFAVLSDILGDEDHLGDMDFKVAGTEQGVTSLQMDIKITGITEEIMRVALEQAREGRLHILGDVESAVGRARRAQRVRPCASRRSRSRPTRSAR